MAEHRVVARLLDVAAADFELVHPVGVDAIVGVAVVLVVRLAQVEGEVELAVDEHVHRLHLLTIDIEAARQDDLVGSGIANAATVAVVAAVAHQHHLALQMRLILEEIVFQERLA